MLLVPGMPPRCRAHSADDAGGIRKFRRESSLKWLLEA